MKTEQKRLATIKHIYEEGSSIFRERTKDVFDKHPDKKSNLARDRFLAYLAPHSSILDIGCGPGRDALYFIQQGHDVVGIDICEAFISELQKTGGGDFVVGDIVDSHENIYQREYDAIWSCASLVHLNRDEAMQTIKNCFSALKTGGYIFIATKYDESESHMEEKESKSNPGIVKPYLYYTEDDLKSDMKSQGFHLLSTEIVEASRGGDRFIEIFAQK